MADFGNEKGEVCNRNGCVGIIAEHPTETSCSCHINPPCSHCVDAREFCDTCGWDAQEEQIDKQQDRQANASPNDWGENYRIRQNRIHDMRSGKLPVEKIEYYTNSHTHFSMEHIGAFPKGTTRAEVEQKVQGSWGGRFTWWDAEAGIFDYIAYTD